jgi:filamentous hemagglutinin
LSAIRGGEQVAGVAVARGIATPYGIATQSGATAALAARSQVQEGAMLYRIGTTGKSQAAEAQFWSLEHPLSSGYAGRYGLPSENVINANFIEAARLRPGVSFVTRPAPGVGQNVGGGIEVVVPSGGVQMQWFTGAP